MRIANVLDWINTHVETRNATFIVRRGVIEITTISHAKPESLLADRVVVAFNGRSLDQAIDYLSDQSGVTMILDPTLGPRLKTPITAAFRNDVSVWSAVHMVAHLAGLRVVSSDGGLYITSPAKAGTLTRQLMTQQVLRLRFAAIRRYFPYPQRRHHYYDPLE